MSFCVRVPVKTATPSELDSDGQSRIGLLAFVCTLILMVACGSGMRTQKETKKSSSGGVALGCPSGYVRVPGNTSYGRSDFCVMKYIASCGVISAINCGNTPLPCDGEPAQTLMTGYPRVCVNRAQASAACSAAGAHLISNAEWQVVARNIEANGANWSNSEVGNGLLNRGHSGGIPGNALGASSDGDYYSGITTPTPWVNKRTHTLSNGQVIWDMAGNVWQWVMDDITGGSLSPSLSTNIFLSFTSVDGSLNRYFPLPSNTGNRWLFAPDGDYDANQNVGQWYGSNGAAVATVLRGGYWSNGAIAGVFSTHLLRPSGYTSIDVGFRCATELR